MQVNSRAELQSRIRGSHAKAAVDCANGYVVLWQLKKISLDGGSKVRSGVRRGFLSLRDVLQMLT